MVGLVEQLGVIGAVLRLSKQPGVAAKAWPIGRLQRTRVKYVSERFEKKRYCKYLERSAFWKAHLKEFGSCG